MRTDDFWAVIERAATSGARSDGGALSDGRAGVTGAADPKVVAGHATDELVARGADAAVAWGRHLDRVLDASLVEDLWAAAYLINGGCSEEGFDEFRGWLVAQGRSVVSRAVREPDSLAELPAVRAAAVDGTEIAGRDVLHLAAEAHLRVTGAGLPPRTEPGPTADLADFWDFDDADEMHRRLPRLSALFLEPPEE